MKALREFIKETFLFGQEITFSDDDSFLEMGIIDSTGVLELVMFLESNFGVSVADDELVPENLDSINNIVSFIEGKHSPSAALPNVTDGQTIVEGSTAPTV
ncbi:MAG: acyl carrier protein [Pirellulales bacterium]|nr:acyl carrier protein [Pirellulales bacterium]